MFLPFYGQDLGGSRNVCVRQRGGKFIGQVSSYYLLTYVSVLLSFLFLYFLKKQQKTQQQQKVTHPCLLIWGPVVNSGFSGPIGRQASAHHIRERRTCMGKVSCTLYLFSSLGILVPSDPGFLSVRAIEGLILRIWYYMSTNCIQLQEKKENCAVTTSVIGIVLATSGKILVITINKENKEAVILLKD